MKLMQAHGCVSLKDVTARGGGTNGALDRMRRGAVAPSVDAVAQLAQAFDLEPWQLLVETLEFVRGEDGRLQVAGLPGWPLPLVDEARYQALAHDQRGFVQAKMMAAIESLEDGAASVAKRQGTLPEFVAREVERQAAAPPSIERRFADRRITTGIRSRRSEDRRKQEK